MRSTSRSTCGARFIPVIHEGFELDINWLTPDALEASSSGQLRFFMEKFQTQFP
jgi:hypothetical protein